MLLTRHKVHIQFGTESERQCVICMLGQLYVYEHLLLSRRLVKAKMISLSLMRALWTGDWLKELV